MMKPLSVPELHSIVSRDIGAQRVGWEGTLRGFQIATGQEKQSRCWRNAALLALKVKAEPVVGLVMPGGVRSSVLETDCWGPCQEPLDPGWGSRDPQIILE